MDLLYLQGNVFPVVSPGEAWRWMTKTSDPDLTDIQPGSH